MYSNGFDTDKVLAALTGRLGWSDSSLSTANREARSGRRFDDGSFHPMVNVDHIKAVCAPKGGNADTFLADLQKAAVMRCMQAVFRAPELLEDTTLFDRIDNMEAPVSGSMFSGYRVKVAADPNITVQAASATLYFDKAATFNLYLYRDGKPAPVKTVSVASLAGEKVTVALDGWVMPAKDAKCWYIGYSQSETGAAMAIRENVSMRPTFTFAALPFLSPLSADTGFDRVNGSYPGTPYGLNLQIGAVKDYTDTITRNARLFDEALGLSMAMMVLEGTFYSTRSNAAEREAKDQYQQAGIQLEVQGALPIENGPRITGIKSRVDKELQRLRDTFFPKAKAQTVNLC